MMAIYLVRYQRTMTIECRDPLTREELRDLADEHFADESALWDVEIDGSTYPLRGTPVKAGA